MESEQKKVKLLLYRLPYGTNQKEVYLALCHAFGEIAADSIRFPRDQPKIIFESLIVEIARSLGSEILKRPPTIRRRLVEAVYYRGPSTLNLVEAPFIQNTIYFKGVPKKASYRVIRRELSELSRGIEYVHIPIDAFQENRHFGFIICKNVREKRMLLELRKLKTKKYKFVFEDYSLKGVKEGQKSLKPQASNIACKEVLQRRVDGPSLGQFFTSKKNSNLDAKLKIAFRKDQIFHEASDSNPNYNFRPIRRPHSSNFEVWQLKDKDLFRKK